MSKFKVGDKVWVKPCEEIENKREHPGFPEDPGFPEEMNKFCGKKITINGDFGDQLYSACGWTWVEDWLESEEEHNARINAAASPENNEPQFYDENDDSHIKLTDCKSATFGITVNEDLRQFINQLFGE